MSNWKWFFTIKGGPGSGHFGHIGRIGRVGGSAVRGTRPIHHQISDRENASAISQAERIAEEETRRNYEVWKPVFEGDKYALVDKRRQDASGIPVSVFEGTEEQVNRQLEKRIKTAKTNIRNKVENRIASFNSEIRQGFYDNVPTLEERARILGLEWLDD